MTRSKDWPVDPWKIIETGLDQDAIAQTESVFALSNGHIGIRGNLDEGDPNGLPGTYLNSFYEVRPLPYAEGGYGYPESGQSVVNVTNGKLIRLLVDDEPLDLRYGSIESHRRELDMRNGVLHREVVWRSPAGTRVRLRTTRLVSLRRRSLMAIRYRVEPVDTRLRVVLQSEIVANEPVPAQSGDPRVAAAFESPLQAVDHDGSGWRAILMHQTRESKLSLAAAMDHELTGPDGFTTEMIIRPDWARFTASTALDPGEEVDLVKYVTYGWSAQRSIPALRDQVAAAIVSAKHAGWDAITKEQTEGWDKFWSLADVEVDGMPEIQQGVRFGMFHTHQAAVRAEQRAIPAKGLTGPGYDGHAFWDTETFVLPLLTATSPHAASDALYWRHSTLDLARERAHTLRLKGATFPWRTIRGQECSAYWPAGTAAMHVNADIATAVIRHVWWTGDTDFERDCGVPILCETARLWLDVGFDGVDGKFHIDGVTGPDEYSALSDDNTYTNVSAARNFVAAAGVARMYPDQAAKYDVTEDEIEAWESAADRMSLPYSERLKVPEQSLGFTDREVWDFARSEKYGEYPLLLHVPYFDLYRTQVIKQSDLMLALHWEGDRFTDADKARAFAYYETLTVRDSSLSACTQAVIAAEVGHHDLAVDYLAEASLMDLHDLESNARDGVHIASLAGAWLAMVAGFGGMRDGGEQLSFRPQLPPGSKRLKFGVLWRGRVLRVEITPGRAAYTVTGDEGMEIEHRSRGRRDVIELRPGKTVTRRWQEVKPRTPRPEAPVGRDPGHAIRN